jgi:hypothetical protein
VGGANGSDPLSDHLELFGFLLAVEEAAAETRALIDELKAAGWRAYSAANGFGWLAVQEVSGRQVRRQSLAELTEAVSGLFTGVYGPS